MIARGWRAIAGMLILLSLAGALVLLQPSEDFFGWALFTVMLLGLAAASFFAAHYCSQSFGVMGTKGPAGWVIWGLRLLALDMAASVITIFVSRVLVTYEVYQMSTQVRSLLFFIYFAGLPVGFTMIARGFRNHAVAIVALRKHWLYTHGFHADVPPLKDE